MESKLKSLKVVDLKAIISQAQITVPAKANKSDLIAKIIASQRAIEVYHKLHSPPDDLLAPPEDLDWNTDQPSSEPKSPVVPKAVDPPSTDPITTNPPSNSTAAAIPEDPEAQKRRQRAARFGIPIVEPPKPRPTNTSRNSSTRNGVKPPIDDSDKLNARTARFGIAKPNEVGQKRSAPGDRVDTEEEEKRKKRAERFGINSTSTRA